MKLQKQLSIKSALRFALPGLASCLLLAACSNEVSDNIPEDLPSETAGTIRFTASAPLASEDVATRIGIGEGKPSVDEWTKDEPVIWLGGEEISVFFVPKGGGSEFHAKFIIDETNISHDGKSADLLNETNLSHLNGEYDIYAFTPYVAGNTLSAVLLDLSNQVQLPSTTTYAHLGATASMRAAGVVAKFTNGSLISGDVNFNFEHITSFLRFNITNDLGEAITVTGITVSHPNMISKSSYSIKDNAQTATINESAISLSFGVGRSLSDKVSFDAYMSTLNVPLTSNFDRELEITISLDGRDPFVFEVLPSELLFNDVSGMFNVGTRFLFDIMMTPSTPPAPDLPPYSAVEYNNNIYTYNQINEFTTPIHVNDNDLYVAYSDLPTACPIGFHYITNTDFGPDVASRVEFFTALGDAYRGVFHETLNYVIATDRLYAYGHETAISFLLSSGEIMSTGVSNTEFSYRPICRKAK